MLSIDGVHIEKDLGLHLLADSDETMMPDTRQDTLTVPGRHGAYIFDSYLEPRRFFPYILIPSQATLNDVQKIVRQVSSLLVDEYGSPKDVKLIYDYEPEKYYIARFTGYIAIDRVAKTGRFPIPFLAYDPFAYASMTAFDSDESQEYDTGIQYDSGLMYKNTDSFNWTVQRQTYGAFNHSSTATEPIITITGKVETPRITNVRNRKVLYLPEMESEDILVIDFKNLTIKKNGDNAFADYSGDFFSLIPGKIELLFEAGSPNAIVDVQWEHKFV
jgi:predicted phage tail component-like protein